MLYGWRTWLAFFIVTSAIGCTNIDVRTDFDRTADFTKFQTFAFAGMSDLNQTGVLSNSLTRNRIETAITRELTKKGLRLVNLEQSPDLSVYYWIGVKEKQRLDTTGPPMGGYGWHGRYGYGYGADYSGVTSYEYKEGTLITDLIETTKKELVWRATMVANLEDTTEENVELGNKAIAKAFENYPPSQSQP